MAIKCCEDAWGYHVRYEAPCIGTRGYHKSVRGVTMNRYVYVGMTRPRKILVIAVPNHENKIAWDNKFSPE